MSKEKGNIIAVCLFIVSLSLTILVINNFYKKYQEPIPMGFSCYTENAVLLNQYIDKTNYTKGGDCSNGCLFMKVYTEHFTFLKCGHVEGKSWLNKTYYFANEGLRNDLEVGDNISVKWCYINKDIGRRIKEVKKKMIQSSK